MTATQRTLGIDFGTSNSAAGYMQDGTVRLVAVEAEQSTLPTAFFFDFDNRATLIGNAAQSSLLNGENGRYMRALKRVLGTGLMHEKRQILNERVTFVDIIGRFLKHLKVAAERESGLPFTHALSGRPVVFHGADDPREAQAEADLRACYMAAGFENVSFMAEPEAAARAADASDTGGLGLIVDIGGGTSDFSVFRQNGASVDILANYGIRIGGTDFDRAVSIDHVMPHLGKGTRLRDVFGPGTSTIPHAIFHKLATWEEIPFLYTAQTRRSAAEMLRQSLDPDRLRRLHTVLEDELGHDVAFAVEAGKIGANDKSGVGQIRLGEVESGLNVELSSGALDTTLHAFGPALRAAAERTVTMARAAPEDIAKVVYVGGSSLMGLVTNEMETLFPAADHTFSEVFTAVAKGLAIAAGDLDAS